MTTETRLVLVRHGESQAQIDRVVAGPSGCTGLSELGRRQVSALAERWERIGFCADALVSSTLRRAIDTAEILAPALGGLAPVADADLCELEPGECDGLTWDEYTDRYGIDPDVDPYTPLSPGGESLAGFLVRVGSALHRLAVDHVGETVVVACHGGVVDGSVATFLGLPTQRRSSYQLQTANSSVTEWGAEVAKGEQVEWSLLRYNDAAHLEGIKKE